MKTNEKTNTISFSFKFNDKMAAAAKVLALRDFTLISTWPELAAKTKEEFDEWLADRGLLWKKRPCSNCGNPRKVTKKASGTGEEALRGDRKKIFLASYLFAYEEVDETYIVHRKYNVGRIVRRDWLVGGIQDGTKLVFMEITDDRQTSMLSYRGM
ncbi:hypothetical protein ANCDUO_13664 [Ancylostoma duodenale]|uniref:Uncharacterized protein n=1 Tax=Ancylostoma duodenale TaxID=51022 RepID=A0A0C2GB75_9BILA|nr:hypothetical protein ANCDUO_13664 [Ancylostoma duodenale]